MGAPAGADTQEIGCCIEKEEVSVDEDSLDNFDEELLQIPFGHPKRGQSHSLAHHDGWPCRSS